MLRLFFGLFAQAASSNWWTIFEYDNALSHFQWGKPTTLDSHTITPTKRHKPYYNGSVVVFDEYIDLNLSVMSKETAEFLAQFTNQAGVTTPYPIAPSALDRAVHNTISVDGEMSEWLRPTHLLSEVFPPVTDPAYLEHFWVVNETLENNPLLAVTGYLSFAGAVKSGSSYGFAADPCIVGYNNINTDVFRVMWVVPDGKISKIVLYRAPVVVSEIRQKFLNWNQWENWRLVHNHLPVAEFDPGTLLTGVVFSDDGGAVRGTYTAHGLRTGAYIDVSGTTNWDGFWRVTVLTANTFTLDTAVWSAGADNTGNVMPSNNNDTQTVSDDYGDATDYPYPTPTRVNWCTFKPLNNAMARMNLVWQKRSVAAYQMLLINTASMQYYKGFLSKLSDVFEIGTDSSDERAAQFSLSLTEHGKCTIDALTAPNTGANFTAATRTL